MEQQSLESAPKDTKKQPEQPVQQASPAGQTPPAVIPPGKPAQQASPTGQVPLSFFESLPKGQKQTVLGSGINEKPKPTTTAASQPPKPAAPATKAPAPQSTRNQNSKFRLSSPGCCLHQRKGG